VPLKRILVPLATLVALAFAGLGFAEPARAATWCGTPGSEDRLPQVAAGYSVHFVYVIPSDGVDQLATWGSVMQTDAETMDAWWRREDPARGPRLDTYPFPCGPQLDITLVRLATTGAETEPIDVRGEKVLQGLSSSRLLDSPYQKIIIYYDGPDSQGGEGVCGEGGQNVAIVYVNACGDLPSDDVAAHELIHALGAVQPSAPHHCPLEHRGHTCDTGEDIMFWGADGRSLLGHLLDPGRDDYYGHGGTWLDVQDSFWLTHLDAQAPLALSLTGQGSVQSNIPGLQCSAACTTQWDTGTQVTLSATPASGQRFLRWSGGCSGTTSACVVKVGEVASVNAVFGPATFVLKVTIGGKGRVRSTPAALICPGRCAGNVKSFSPTALFAIPSKGWRFSNWFGACRGTATRCLLPMKSDRVARAVFVRVKKKGTPAS
jgi:List-Bact-rpt repeat protein